MIPILEGVVPFARRSLRERSPASYAALSVAATALLCVVVQMAQRMSAPLSPMSFGEMALVWDLFALGLLSALALLAAPAVAGAAMAHELRSGTVDALRGTPIGPGGLVLGVALGSPAPAYLLCTGPALLHLLVGVFGPVPLGVAVSSLLLGALGSLAMSLLCVALPLVLPRQRVSGGLAALPVLFFLWASFVNMATASSGASAMFSFLTPAGAVTVLYLEGVQQLARHGRSFAEASAWLGLMPVLSAVFSAQLCGLGAMVAMRKLRDPECAALTQRQAVGWFYSGVAALLVPLAILGYGWSVRAESHQDRFYLGIALLFGGLPLLLFFGGAATPVRARWARYLRGALHASEGAAPYRAIAAMAVGLLGGAALLWGCEGLGHLSRHPSDGAGLLLLWAWLVLLLSTGLQGARAVALTPGGAGALVMGLMVTLVALLIGLSFWSDSAQHGRSQLLLGLGVLLTVPVWVYLWERRVARALRG